MWPNSSIVGGFHPGPTSGLNTYLGPRLGHIWIWSNIFSPWFWVMKIVFTVLTTNLGINWGLEPIFADISFQRRLVWHWRNLNLRFWSPAKLGLKKFTVDHQIVWLICWITKVVQIKCNIYWSHDIHLNQFRPINILPTFTSYQTIGGQKIKCKMPSFSCPLATIFGPKCCCWFCWNA